MSLTENLQKWDELRTALDELEYEISQEVLALGKTQSYGNVEAKYRKASGNGSYNYEAICHEIEPDPDEELVLQYTVTPEPYIDYKALAEALGVDDEVKQRYYTPPANSSPTVKVGWKK